MIKRPRHFIILSFYHLSKCILIIICQSSIHLAITHYLCSWWLWERELEQYNTQKMTLTWQMCNPVGWCYCFFILPPAEGRSHSCIYSLHPAAGKQVACIVFASHFQVEFHKYKWCLLPLSEFLFDYGNSNNSQTLENLNNSALPLGVSLPSQGAEWSQKQLISSLVRSQKWMRKKEKGNLHRGERERLRERLL